MVGLMIKDIYTLRYKIFYMMTLMSVVDLAFVIVAKFLKVAYVYDGKMSETTVRYIFNSGIIIASVIGVMVLFMMCGIVVNDNKEGWNRMLMSFPVSVLSKASSRFLTFFLIGTVGGFLQYLMSIVLYRMLDVEISMWMVKFTFAPFAIGIVFVLLRLMFEYLFNTPLAYEYSAILFIFCIAACYIIYRFGDIDFPDGFFDIVKVYVHYIDRRMIFVIPSVLVFTIVATASKLRKKSQ